MSLRAKIAIGVLAATAVLAAALAFLGLEAQRELKRTALQQRDRTIDRFTAYREEQRLAAVRSIEGLVLAWVGKLTGYDQNEMRLFLAQDDNGFSETAYISREPDGSLELWVQKPQGSRVELSADDSAHVLQVFSTGKYRFDGDVLYYPFFVDQDPARHLVLRLQLPVVKPPEPHVDMPETADLGPLAWAGFITLAVAMLAVFILLMYALRRFVLAPLGNVLEHSERIVKGAGGFEVRGLKGGKGGDIETLVAAFNAMFAELKDYQSDLEGKVKDATRTIKQQQQSLVIAQRLAATGTLAAGLAHEVNNPLSGMLNAARRLRMREGLDERAIDYVQLIEEGLGRIESLMKQILDFSRRRDMKPERFAPENALRRSIPLVRHRVEKNKLRLEEDIQPELPVVFGNEEEISQVLMNLLINATDAAPEGGTVRASISKAVDGGVTYTIEDSGTGVPEEIVGRIFDPFFTTKEPGRGTGLGLAIVHTIVDNHGGTIRVERSTRLGGAKFMVDLPPAQRQESTRKLLPTAD